MAGESRGHSLQGAIVPRLLDLSQLSPGINTPLELVKPGSACYGIQLRMLSTGQVEPLVWIFGRNGGLQIRIRGQGDSFYFDRPINDGIYLGALVNGATNPGVNVPFPIGTWAEVLILTQPGIRLPDVEGDPWRLAPAFSAPRIQVGIAGQFPQIMVYQGFGSINAVEAAFKGKHVIISSDVAGEVVVGFYQGGGIGGEVTTNPQPLYVGGQAAGLAPNASRCAVSGFNNAVLLQTAAWKQFQVLAGAPFTLPIDDVELSKPIAIENAGGISRHGLIVAGPAGVTTLRVSFEWKERIMGPA